MPENTRPRLIPTRTANGPSCSIAARAASSTRSSSVPVESGAPPTRRSFTPFAAMSDSWQETCWCSAARWTAETRSRRAIASASGPSSASRRSVPEASMNATVTGRCSGSRTPESRRSRSATGMQRMRSTLARSTGPAAPARRVGRGSQRYALGPAARAEEAPIEQAPPSRGSGAPRPRRQPTPSGRSARWRDRRPTARGGRRRRETGGRARRARRRSSAAAPGRPTSARGRPCGVSRCMSKAARQARGR